MKQYLFTTLLLGFSLNAFAFKLTIASNYSFNTAGTECQVISSVGGTHVILADSGGIINQKGAGLELCRQLGKFPMTASGLSSSTDLGTYFRHTSDVPSTNCADRTTGVATGSITCQSTASYSTAQ
jgi:hypothetical protein